MNALIKLYFKIPFPEKLSDEDWVENIHQLEWLAENKLLGNNIN